MTNENSQPMDWDAYAAVYDVMSRNNPYYLQNLELLKSALSDWSLGSNPSVCDIGAGTGEYILNAASVIPSARFVHVDGNAGMSAVAEKKYVEAGLDVEIITDYVQRLEFDDESFDLLICVNALYAMTPQEVVLKKFFRWLKPDGKLFVIDFGRKQDWKDWFIPIYTHMVRERGLLSATREVFNFADVIRQNAMTTKGQSDGGYPLHTNEEFNAMLESAGFQVEHSQECYRDYCDLALCSRPLSNQNEQSVKRALAG